MTRLTSLWIALTALGMTALLVLAASALASLVTTHVYLPNHQKWWWSLVTVGLTATSLGIFSSRRTRRDAGGPDPA
jgi:hypothetical protein